MASLGDLNQLSAVVRTDALERLEGSFADAVRGLHLYGAKVLDGARLFDLQANP